MGIFSLFKRGNFAHGIHPPGHKAVTAGIPIRRLPFPSKLILPLAQHIGAPSKAVVQKGQEVVRGEPIAVATADLSVPIHAPATGRISGIELVATSRGSKDLSIILEPYPGSSQQIRWRHEWHADSLERADLLLAIQDTGLVGLGGAAFPSHFKHNTPDEKPVDILVVNGSECEPYLTCDHRMMLEYPEQLVRGIHYALKATGTREAIIGIEDNKMDAAAVLQQQVADESQIRVQVVKTKYPQGSEKMLIKSLLNREVPAGGIPADIGVVVNNVSTLAALGHLLPSGEGLTERVITVTGPGIKQPGNYMVPIGTTVGFILEQLGYQGEAAELIMGGPMMGPAVSSLDTPITKGCSGLLVLDEPSIEAETRHAWPCIKCGRCVNACPMNLNPSQLGLLASAGEFQAMADDYALNHCFECGCCSYICPSNIPLVQYFRIAKSINRERAA